MRKWDKYYVKHDLSFRSTHMPCFHRAKAISDGGNESLVCYFPKDGQITVL